MPHVIIVGLAPFSGHQHAGENLQDVLRHRDPQLPPPIQMCARFPATSPPRWTLFWPTAFRTVGAKWSMSPRLFHPKPVTSHTCRLNDVNPFDYLLALARHHQEVAEHPEAWLPWIYRTTVEAANTS